MQNITMTCGIHGESEALMSGACRLCRDEKPDRELERSIVDQMPQRKKLSDIPKRYENSSIKNYNITNEFQQKVVNHLKNYKFDRDLIMLGSKGTGKTHLAISILNQLLRYEYGKYIRFYDLIDIKIQDYKTFKLIRDVPFLIIDEYGRQETDFTNGLLFNVLDYRYSNQLYTCIISNLGPEAFKLSLDTALYSRLKENYLLLFFDWDDYRISNKA